MIITIADTFDTYKWNLPSSIDSTLKIKASGIYWVQVTKGPCSITDSIVVKDVYPYIALDANTLLCNGEQLTLKATSIPGSKYSWQNGSSADTFRVKEKGIYEVTVTNICGVFTARAVVNYRQCECNPFVPSAFTPNNDGWNDALKPRMECSPVSYHFMIANRRGQIVFESYDVNERWDGNFKGQKAGVDTYYYYLRLTDVQGIRTEHKGDILLLR
jgi:gliding motility-associated-like protein